MIFGVILWFLACAARILTPTVGGVLVSGQLSLITILILYALHYSVLSEYHHNCTLNLGHHSAARCSNLDIVIYIEAVLRRSREE